MLWHNLLISGFTVNEFDGQVFRSQVPWPHPGAHVNFFTKAQLPIPASIHVDFQARPIRFHPVFPGCQHPRLLVAVLLNQHALLNLRNVIARSVFLHHPPHTESRSAGTNRFLHHGHPAVWDTVQPLVIVGWHNLFFQYLVQGKAVGLVLYILVMKLALFTDCPAVLTVISLCPPAVENTTVWLPVQRGFLVAGAAGLVWTDGVVEPQVYPGDQVACHIYIVVFQENDLTPELVSA